MNIQDNLLSINQMTRPGIKIKSVKKIVVHYVANPGSTAIANRNYFESLSRQTDRYASSHYIIGLEGEVIRCIPETEVAYHAGDLEMNYNSIGIENCHFDSSGKFNEKTLASLYELLVELCKKYNLDPSADIIRHYDVTGKICPKYYVDNLTEWNNLKAEVINRMGGTSITTPVANNSTVKKYVVIPAIGLNCRENPDVNSKRITGYPVNSIIEIYEESNGWGRTKNGWVSMQYLRSTDVQNTTTFTVRVDKKEAAVREQPNSKSALAGTQILYQGNTFKAVGTVIGENVSGNNIWYKSVKNNYVWSGGLTRI